MKRILLSLTLLLLLAGTLSAAEPVWIWTGPTSRDGEVVLFRHEFTVPEGFGAKLSGTLRATCDNHFKAWINAQPMAAGDAWEEPVIADVSKVLKPGLNTIVVEARNDGGPAGLILSLDIAAPGNKKLTVATDANWLTQPFVKGWESQQFDARAWKKSHVVAKLGEGPWGAVFQGQAGVGGRGHATPAESLSLLPGFKAELLYSVPKGQQGSWVNLCFDPRGRLIVSNQNGLLYRVTLDKPEKGQVEVEPIDVRTKSNAQPIGKAHGLCYAFNSLYVMVADGGGEGNGLYRLRDTDGDDKFDTAELLKRIEGGGEHGPHAVRLAPDGKSLYVIAGNHTRLPRIDASRVVRRWDEDQLLPRMNDAGGHAVGVMAPGGWICRIDPEAKHWELICSGFRNEFDIDFNPDGELFTYDSDMEWDVGMPWYRPTRINHCVSGAEFGWRHGSGKWPDYYPDSLPATVNIGLGSPTGVTFGTGARFPARYQRALFALDWTYGIIYAVHLYSNGATYLGEPERFVSGKPLPVTDVAIGPDGAMYFTIGGRGTQSGLYRVSYIGTESTEPAKPAADTGLAARQRRHELERFHGIVDPRAVDTAWPMLNDADRFIRYAARTAIEHQPVAQWRARALAERQPVASIAALLALTRCGEKSDLAPIVERLNALPWSTLSESQRLDSLRVYALAVIRLGQPQGALRDAIIARLSPLLPATSFEMNRELSALLLVLEAPGAVARTMALLQTAETPREQMAYAYNLRPSRTGWTPELRREYFAWFNVAANYRGGASLVGYIRNMKTEAVATLTDAEKTTLASVLNAKPVAVKPVEVKPRPVVREYTLTELVPIVEKGLTKRDYNRGRAMFTAAQCVQCHRFGGDGGATGPDLTGVAGRFSVRDLLEATVEPSKVISDQYHATVLNLKDGKTVTGRIVAESADAVRAMTDPLKPEQVLEVAKSRIESREISKVSTMPTGLLNTLTRDEILDLVAYLLSGGDRGHAAFK